MISPVFFLLVALIAGFTGGLLGSLFIAWFSVYLSRKPNDD